MTKSCESLAGDLSDRSMEIRANKEPTRVVKRFSYNPRIIAASDELGKKLRR
jgi:hypothetical protein